MFCEDTGRIDFIVGGILHTVLLNSLYGTLPASRIGKLIRARTVEEVLSYCDKYETEGREQPTVMFDRSAQIVFLRCKIFFIAMTEMAPALTQFWISTEQECFTFVTALVPPSGMKVK